MVFIKRIKDPNHPWNNDVEHDLAIWITLITNINSWTKNELDYIEKYFINLFSNTKNFTLKNKTIGNNTNHTQLNSEKKFVLNSFIEAILNKLMMIAREELFDDLDELEKVKNTYTTDKDNETLVEIYAQNKNKQITKAIFNKKTNSIMLQEGTIIKNTKRNVDVKKPDMINGALVKDTWITSPSKAAKLISGYSVNGWDFWNVASNNKKLQSIREK